MTAVRDSMWNTAWNDVHLTLFDFNDLVVNQKIHLPLKDQ